MSICVLLVSYVTFSYHSGFPHLSSHFLFICQMSYFLYMCHINFPYLLYANICHIRHNFNTCVKEVFLICHPLDCTVVNVWLCLSNTSHFKNMCHSGFLHLSLFAIVQLPMRGCACHIRHIFLSQWFSSLFGIVQLSMCGCACRIRHIAKIFVTVVFLIYHCFAIVQLAATSCGYACHTSDATRGHN